MRLAEHVRTTGWRFPTFSDDPVVQFAVEEALVVKLGAHENRLRLKRETAANVMAAQNTVREQVVARRRELARV